MGRKVIMVPADWQHPKDTRGHYIPLHQRFPYNEREIAEGLADGWLTNTPPNYGIGVMPDWPAEQRTHLMMYETTSEGTPISPAFETPEELARWLADNNASAFGSHGASYESWLAVAREGWAPSAVMDARGLRSGVEFIGERDGAKKAD